MTAIEFSDEQSMILETAVNFFREKFPISEIHERNEKLEGSTDLFWAGAKELGWTGIVIPENYGGLSLSLSEVVPIVEMMGRHLIGSPFIPTTLAVQAIVSAGSEEQKARWLPLVAEGGIASVGLTEEDGSWCLSEAKTTGEICDGELILRGKKCFVLDVKRADFIVVSAIIDNAVSLIIVTREQLNQCIIRSEVVIDETRQSFSVEFNDLKIPLAQILEQPDLNGLESAALILVSAEISGGLSGVLRVILSYLTTRKQFGKYIGSYQSLKHPAVQILLSLESTRSHLYHAAACLAGGDKVKAEIAVRSAKAYGSDAFAFAGDRAIQFHGGFGFTYECDAQLFLRRALWCQYQYGDAAYHHSYLAPLLLD